MKSNHFDVIIVGGGPAGSAASFTLANSGISVCVVDRYTFPRDKLCGGLLTLRSKKIFDEIFGISWDPVIDMVSRGVRFYYKSNLLNSVEDYKDLYFTTRYNFDNYLLRQSEKAGTNLFLGNAVKSINIKDNSIALGNGTLLTYDYLIGADGVNSIVARTLFGKSFDKSTIAYALEIEIPINDKYKRIDDPEIYFGVVRWGYGWVFPKKDTLTTGIGGLHEKNEDIKKEFLDFLKMRFGEVPEVKIKGNYLPFGNYREQPGGNNILLCGDAAGLVDPITGEGIAFAMQSGHFAALSIIDVLKKNTSMTVLDLYIEKYKLYMEFYAGNSINLVVMIGGYVLWIILSFVGPIWLIHKKLTREKCERLLSLNGLLKHLQESLSNGGVEKYLKYKIYRDQYFDVNRISTWPVDVQNVMTVVVSVALPIILTYIQIHFSGKA